MKAQEVPGATLGGLQSDELIGSIMDGVRRTPQERPRTLASVRSAFVAIVAAVFLIAGGLIALPRLTSFGGFGGSAVLTYHADGLQFDYPASWRLTPSTKSFGLTTRIVAFVGTGEGAAPCDPPSIDGSRLCSIFTPSLAPDQIVLEIAVDDTTPWQPTEWLNPPDTAWNIVVGGLPATTGRSVVVAHKVGADVVTCWVLTSAQDENRHYVLTAAMRGPNIAPLKAQMDALLASVTFDPPK
jgi:hypothetical protein